MNKRALIPHTMTIKKSQLHPTKALARHLGGRLARRRRELGMTAADLDAAVRTIAGSARSMGVNVEGV